MFLFLSQLLSRYISKFYVHLQCQPPAVFKGCANCIFAFSKNVLVLLHTDLIIDFRAQVSKLKHSSLPWTHEITSQPRLWYLDKSHHAGLHWCLWHGATKSFLCKKRRKKKRRRLLDGNGIRLRGSMFHWINNCISDCTELVLVNDATKYSPLPVIILVPRYTELLSP